MTTLKMNWAGLLTALRDGELVLLETRLGLMRVRHAEKHRGYVLVHGTNEASGAPQSSSVREAA